MNPEDDFRCLDCNDTFRRGWCKCGKSHAAWYIYPNYFSASGNVVLTKQPSLTREATGGDQATQRQTRGEE